MRRCRFVFFVIVFLMIIAPIVSYALSDEEEFSRAAALFNEGEKLYNISDFRGAIEKWEAALATFQKLGRKKAIGAAIGNLGLAYNILGDYRKSITYFEKALAIAEEMGDKQNKGSWLGNLGLAYSNLGDYKKAIDYHEKALAIAEETGDKQGKGTRLNNLGLVYHYLGDFRKSIAYYEKALAIAEEIGDKQNKGRRLGNLGNAYGELVDYRKEIAYYEKALAIADEIGDKLGKGNWLGHLGIAYGKLGDYRKAIDYFEKALAIADEIGDKGGKEHLLGNLGNAYRQLGDYRKAIDYFEKALAIADEIGYKEGKGNHLNRLGLAHSDLGDYRKAIEYYEKALAIKKEIGVPYGYLEGNMGDAYLAMDKDKEAFDIYIKQDHPIRLGMYYLKKKDFKEAAKQFDRNREEDEKRKNAGVIIPEWMGLGISYEGMKEYETAYKWYKKAIDFLEDQRGRLSPSEREHFFEGKEFGFPRIEAYEGAVRCAFMLNRFDEAFYWAENTRGRIFAELISSRHSKANYKIPASLAKEEEDRITRIMINKKQQQTAFEKNNPELLKQLEQEYPALKENMDKLIDRLRREYPQYASIKYPQPVKLNQLSLKKGETIIEYEVTEQYTIGLVIKDGKVIKGFRIEKTRAELEAMVKKFRSPFQEGNDPKGFNLSLAEELTDLLLKPALSVIQKGEHLVIIPDESLSLLPFEAMLMSGHDDKSGKGSKPVYAIDEYRISYYQAASVLSLMRGLNITRFKDPAFFGIGDPVFDTKDTRTASLRGVKIVAKQTQDITDSKATKEAGYQFQRLPNTEKEVKEVGRLFGSSMIFTGSNSSEEKVKAEDLSTRRYLLFSTHGILGNEIPYIKQPALVLNLIGNDKEDGFLTAGEIFGMNLNADLVGLSACKTGLGIQSAGEGVVGLSRAFMYAGTDSVLVSLWSVADDSTYKMMVKFFEGLKAGKDKITALKAAKDYLRANGYDNPFYWAPFILHGER
ncbi:MAG: CHAT domain-containing tetratricopeptide repeat protein [Nitrospirota bacterium]